MQPLILLLALLCFIVPSFCFHVTRNTEIGLCTVTDDKNHPHKFSCLQGDRNYCCGDRYNQTCCSVDEVSTTTATSYSSYSSDDLYVIVCESAQDESDSDHSFSGPGQPAVRGRRGPQPGHCSRVPESEEEKERAKQAVRFIVMEGGWQ